MSEQTPPGEHEGRVVSLADAVRAANHAGVQAGPAPAVASPLQRLVDQGIALVAEGEALKRSVEGEMLRLAREAHLMQQERDAAHAESRDLRGMLEEVNQELRAAVRQGSSEGDLAEALQERDEARRWVDRAGDELDRAGDELNRVNAELAKAIEGRDHAIESELELCRERDDLRAKLDAQGHTLLRPRGPDPYSSEAQVHAIIAALDRAKLVGASKAVLTIEFAEAEHTH